MPTGIYYVPLGCPYVHIFTRYPSGQVERCCIRPENHEGNHVVIEPGQERPLEVPRVEA
jgi:hypothetical protein